MDKVAIGPNGERVIYRLAQDESGNQYWKQLGQDAVGFTGDKAQAAYSAIARGLEKGGNILADRRDEGQKLRQQMVDEMSPWDRAMVSAGQATSGFTEGVPNALLKMKALGKYMLPGGDDGIADMQQALKNDAERKETGGLMREFNYGQGIAGVAGAMLPYILTSTLAGPASRKVADRAIDTAVQVADVTKAEAKSLLERGVSAASKSSIPGIKQFGQKAQTEWVDTLKNMAAEAKKRPEWANPYRKDILGDVLGSTILGGVEGALNQDLDIKSGAEAGLFGGMLGRTLKYKLEPAPLPDKPAYNELMARRKAWGRRNTPGEVLDSPVLQTRESGYRNDNRTSQLMKYFDEANQKADNAYAFDAMGYTGSTLDKSSLNAHVKALGDEYNSLTSQVSARLSKQDLNELYRHTLSLAGQASDEGVKSSKLANDWLKKFQILRKQQAQVRRPNGQFDAQLGGKTWQELRAELKEDIRSAYERNEPKLGASLKPFLAKLDNAAEQGVLRMGKTPEESAQLLANYRDLDERYAMSKIIKEHGLDDITLNISPTKLHNYFKSDDPERYITGNYGKNTRINKLYDVAEGRPLDLELAGSTLSSDRTRDNIGKAKRQTLLGQLTNLPAALVPSFLDDMGLRLYLHPNLSPQVKGLSMGALNSNAPGTLGGIRKTGTYTRSLAQATQLAPTILDYLQHPVDRTKEKVKEWWEQ